MNIRKAIESDFEQINVLFMEFAVFEKLPEQMVNTVERMKDEQEFLNCWVMEMPDNKIIGYVTYFFCYYTWTGKAMYMDDLYVKPEFRGIGIGTQLINKVIQYAKETGCHKLRWQVSSWNSSSIDFYKKLGADINSIEQNCALMLN
ncbi:Spermidine N(1)-acetyltransferase [termite gut metagenome]|uniref:Spermidine N(1)-acetyltransferase n=1 Tax=termite gut metagenome TaxID=433724 RepID=A0A5J4Q4D9_9ZZZZ